MKRNLLIGAIVLLLVIGALYGNLSNREQNNAMPEQPEVGYRSPSFDLEGLDGKKYKLKNLNKPVVVNFWASWCGPCKIEAPVLLQLHEKYGDQVQFYAVNLTHNDKLEKVEAFVNDYQFQFPILLDTNGQVSRQYRVTAIPSTFFIDRHQTIMKAAPGLHTKEQMEQWIQQLIEIP
ncbi:hypothetical protein BEP19_06330 [Ammoniphilus oxalaticus]|uniref:Thioredoxin domain-containing protein n=1 Tax=Ammoniphilus oxalaticus TaxID=66863 RepID=A0A419SJ36_9BACL|nr:TlpA disulfide reductase family protein [Ammoniphilus oxalaticus]RKD24023.1 hypothetical protein BEP19_06330 [Ammoniphilus oxalaticus]